MIKCPTCGEKECITYWGDGEYNCNECNTQFDVNETSEYLTELNPGDMVANSCIDNFKNMLKHPDFRNTVYELSKGYDATKLTEYFNNVIALDILNVCDKDYITEQIIDKYDVEQICSFVELVNEKLEY